jgi:hypothetical protein
LFGCALNKLWPKKTSGFEGEETMKVLQMVLCAVLLTVALNIGSSVSNRAFANSPGRHSHAIQAPATTESQKTDAEKSFTQMKSLAGKWEGRVTVTPKMPEMDGALMEVTLRVTSRGNALVHEMKGAGEADDPARYDHPVTMLYRDGDRLLLTHYCDAGNRPRMTGKLSADGKKVEFEFLDVAGSTAYGHMHQAAFTAIDANHHTEDWTFMMGDKPVQAHFDLQRAK